MTFAIKKIKANKRVVGAIVGFPTIVRRHSGLSYIGEAILGIEITKSNNLQLHTKFV